MSNIIHWLASIEQDPLADYAIFKNSSAVRHAAHLFGWPYLPDHLHEILFFTAVHLAVYFVTDPLLSSATSWYPKLSHAKKTGVSVHASSMLNAVLSLVLSFPLFFSYKLTTLVSYTPYAGLVAACLSGYFLFDLVACAISMEENGWGFFCHAAAALFVFLQGNRPFMHNYSAPYIWFEASTPFVNFNWLASTVPNLISKQAQTLNGVFLILVFFLCRIVPGPINGYNLFKVALFTPLPGVPKWVVYVIMTCYSVLTLLNFFWFGKMLSVAYEVLSGKGKTSEPAVAIEKIDAESTVKANTSTQSTVRNTTSARRKRKV